MVKLEDLTDIPEEQRRAIIACLANNILVLNYIDRDRNI